MGTGDESVSSVSNKIELNFNHPCKELVWVVQKDSVVDSTTMEDYCGKQWFNYTDGIDESWTTGTPVDVFGGGLVNGHMVIDGLKYGYDGSAKLQLNGHDRFSERMGRYFNLVQPYQHHTNVPSTGINVYSFGLKPEEHQPSGTCNMSRIDNATLQLTLTANTVSGSSDAKVRVYATNYNVLRIMSGMGGLAYSN